MLVERKEVIETAKMFLGNKNIYWGLENGPNGILTLVQGFTSMYFKEEGWN